MHSLLKISSRISVIPVIHGSADSALQVRKCMLENEFDCVAVPLPPSFQADVERGIDFLPMPMAAVQSEQRHFYEEWTPDHDADEPSEPDHRVSYVPIDPCQPVIAGVRIAIGEHIPRAFIDLETEAFIRPTPKCSPLPYLTSSDNASLIG